MNHALKIHEFMGIVDCSEPCPPQFLLDSDGKEMTTVNPAYSLWYKKDQFLLSWINATLVEKVLSMAYTSRQVWSHLAKKFASLSKPHINHIK